MKNKTAKLVIAGLFLTGLCAPAFSQSAYLPFYSGWIGSVTETIFGSTVIDEPVVNNKYLMESIRANNLSRMAFDEGDYDLSVQFAEDALRAARLSDELITQKLKVAKAKEKIDEASARLSRAESSNAVRRYPGEFNDAKSFYNQALIAEREGKWGDALNNAIYTVQLVDRITMGSPAAAAPRASAAPSKNNKAPLPAQYKVQKWNLSGDCFWNIAGRPWAYGNPYKWPLLYQANKGKLPNPDNPNIITPGTVLDIPSISGEARSGLWDSSKKYDPFTGR